MGKFSRETSSSKPQTTQILKTKKQTNHLADASGCFQMDVFNSQLDTSRWMCSTASLVLPCGCVRQPVWCFRTDVCDSQFGASIWMCSTASLVFPDGCVLQPVGSWRLAHTHLEAPSWHQLSDLFVSLFLESMLFVGLKKGIPSKICA